MRTDGLVEPGWEGVADAFAANFDERGEVGASVCAYLDGRKVVDLWGGVADPTSGRPWAEDTIVTVFSSTKGVTAAGANLAIERGLLDPDATVASYWPEFAAGGKEAITVRQVLSHQAGLPLVEADLSLDEALAWDPVVTALAAQAPLWEPGTQHGYHMRTFGWLVGELLRRTTGRTPGTFLREEVTGPCGAELWVGLPAELEPRVATLVPPATSLKDALAPLGDTLLLARVFSNPGGHFDYDDMWNTRRLRACELPSSNGVGNARGLARIYAGCIGDGVDGHRVLAARHGHRRHDPAGERSRRRPHDRHLLRPGVHARLQLRSGEPADRVRACGSRRLALVRRPGQRPGVRVRAERPALRPRRRPPQRDVGARRDGRRRSIDGRLTAFGPAPPTHGSGQHGQEPPGPSMVPAQVHARPGGSLSFSGAERAVRGHST